MAMKPAKKVEKPLVLINAPTILAMKNNVHQGKKNCAKNVKKAINISCAINFIMASDLKFA